MPNDPAARRPRSAPTAGPHGPVPQPQAKAVAANLQSAEHLQLDLPLLGTVQLPRPEQLAYYAAVATLAALEIIDWPLALIVAGGHALASQQHYRVIAELGEGLEEGTRD
ncbi:MAG: hypothetical protein M3Y77_00210 [Actinomycetota bacterium]|nr:hypothetical protein [Actinomycetota bacterium]